MLNYSTIDSNGSFHFQIFQLNSFGDLHMSTVSSKKILLYGSTCTPQRDMILSGRICIFLLLALFEGWFSKISKCYSLVISAYDSILLSHWKVLYVL